MSTFDELFAAAKAAPKKSVSLEVSLDGDVSEQIQKIEEEIAYHADLDRRLTGISEAEKAAREKLDALLTSSTDVLVTLKFYRMPGLGWAGLTAAHPARPGVLIDMRYGYNFHAVAEAAAPTCGRRVDGDDEIAMTAEQWHDLLEILSGYDVQRICDVLFQLNEWDPEQAVARLKKGSTPTIDSDQRLSKQ